MTCLPQPIFNTWKAKHKENTVALLFIMTKNKQWKIHDFKRPTFYKKQHCWMIKGINKPNAILDQEQHAYSIRLSSNIPPMLALFLLLAFLRFPLKEPQGGRWGHEMPHQQDFGVPQYDTHAFVHSQCPFDSWFIPCTFSHPSILSHHSLDYPTLCLLNCKITWWWHVMC